LEEGKKADAIRDLKKNRWEIRIGAYNLTVVVLCIKRGPGERASNAS